ncbi:methyltransferase-like protein 22 [Exaiptasia diaphana]|uniref:Methyltransferase-like protein 22 n=1 Tax=Exaiptasia diaphana TaxID=2652724 RepID=A0A913XA24_EXADI|nr:methyltransferase-like protein 22 [Exaiptasia diaphana]
MEPNETVLSDVHVFAPFLKIENSDTALTRFVIKQPKQNNEKDVDHGSINTVMKDDEGDFVVDRGIKYDNEPCDVIIIEHQLATVLKDVGLQVWRGALLLADYLLENEDMFAGCYGLELGAGVGLCSVVLGRVASAVFCTDFGDDVLRNCHKNAEMNAHLYKNTSVNKDEGQVSPVVKVRELDWTKGIILSSTSNGMEECYRWSKTDTDELKKVTVFFAADVIYDDKLTDALFNQVLHLLQQNQQATFYLSIEKRLNFTMEDLDVVCPAYKYYLQTIQRLQTKKILHVKQIPTTFTQFFNYERVKELELWEMKAHGPE